jgi:spore coat polysaccharide biosynthesis protein SpsF
MIGKARVILMVQARMGSSRLPGKVMLKVSGRPILAYQLQRLAQCAMCDDIVVITSTLREDDVIHKFCETLGFRCFKGHPVDLLDRHYRAAQAFAADVIIKIPSDCPLVDPELVDQVISITQVTIIRRHSQMGLTSRSLILRH